MSRGLGKVERSLLEAVDGLKHLEHRPELWLLVAGYLGTHPASIAPLAAAREARRRAAHSLAGKGEVQLMHARASGRVSLLVRRPTSQDDLATATELRNAFREHEGRLLGPQTKKNREEDLQWLRWYSGPLLTDHPIFNAACFVNAGSGYPFVDRGEVSWRGR